MAETIRDPAKPSKRSQRPVWLGEDHRTWDHIRVHIDLLDDPEIDAHSLAVYLGLARHAELRGGEAYPAKETLAKYTSLSERTVYTAIKTLERTGWIRVERLKGRSSHYYLLSPPRHQVPTSVGEQSTNSQAPPADDPGTSCQTPRHQVPKNKNHEPEPETRQHPFVSDETESESIATARRLCDQLANCIQANGRKRPKVTTAWIKDMDLLLRRGCPSWDTPEPVHEEVVAKALTWSQFDSFWCNNIRSPKKLREHFETLTIRACKPANAAQRSEQGIDTDRTRPGGVITEW